MVHGLLLRAPQGHPDRYESALASVDVIPLSIPVLETVLVNQTELRCIVENGPQKSDVDGVIITSARACEAWGAAVRSLGGSHPNVGWHDVPFYVVGTGTAESLSTIATHNRESPHIPHDIRGGVESGTGERLAQFIVQDASRVPTDRQGGGHRYLFLTGDKNRETLPLILSAGGISLDSLMVYETRGSSTFSANLSTSLSSVQQDKALEEWWIVYFAPSVADFVTPVLRNHFDLEMRDEHCRDESLPVNPISRPRARVACIGPTTSAFLRDTLNIRVDVVSPKPTPEALATAIKAFTEGH